MALRARLGPLLIVVVVVAGCQLLPAAAPSIDCVDVPTAECEREAARLIEEARRAGKRIVSIRLTAHDGGEVMYDDGTGMVWMP